MKKLYLDDIRIPKTDGWDIVRSHKEFVEWITINGVPNEISFDHDLADIHYNPFTQVQGFKYHEETGYDSAKWLCQHCWDNGIPLPKWNVHSANPVGRDNINNLLRNFKDRHSN